jgi:hypothetical protein
MATELFHRELPTSMSDTNREFGPGTANSPWRATAGNADFVLSVQTCRTHKTKGETDGISSPTGFRVVSILGGLVSRTVLLTSLTFACGGVAAQDRAFDFALIGDMPYTKVQEVEYQRVFHSSRRPIDPIYHHWSRSGIR